MTTTAKGVTEAIIEKYASACKRNAYEMKTMPMTAIRQHFSEFADEIVAALSLPAPGEGEAEDEFCYHGALKSACPHCRSVASFSAKDRPVSTPSAALDRTTLPAAEGMVIVPREPTPEMLAAWYRYKNGHHWHDEPPPRDTSDYGAYAAMLAAAPNGAL